MPASARRRKAREKRFVLFTDWKGYQNVLEALGHSKIRVTYSQGRLEFMTTSFEHEYLKRLLGSLIAALFEELARDYGMSGSPTIKLESTQSGLEPDTCFWFGESLAIRPFPWLAEGPPPDLVVEINVTRGIVPRLPVHAGLGIAEVWRYRFGRLHVLCLQPDGEYVIVRESPTFPGVPISVVAEHLALGATHPTSHVLRRFRAWVRKWLAKS